MTEPNDKALIAAHRAMEAALTAWNAEIVWIGCRGIRDGDVDARSAMTEPEVEELERWANCRPSLARPDMVLALCAAWRAQQAEIVRLTELVEVLDQALEEQRPPLEARFCRQQHSVP